MRRTETDDVEGELVEPALDFDDGFVLGQRPTGFFSLGDRLKGPGLNSGLSDDTNPLFTKLQRVDYQFAFRGSIERKRTKGEETNVAYLLALLDDHRRKSTQMRRTEARKHELALALVRIA